MRPKILAELAAGKRLALVSDAGTPLISDPGQPLIRAARGRSRRPCRAGSVRPNCRVERRVHDRPLHFCRVFADKSESGAGAGRHGRPEGYTGFVRSPAPIARALADIVDRLGDREVSIARELTKKFETVITAPASALAAELRDDMLRGECVVLIAPRASPAQPDEKELDALLVSALEGFSLRDAVSEVTRATGLSRRTVYDRALTMNKNKKNPNDKGEEKTQS